MTTFLLDTHTFLWFINGDPTLSSTGRGLIESADNILYLSMASLWEMAIKVSLGKLHMPTPFTEFIEQQLNQNHIALLPISAAHVGVIATLPFHHRDPFDRLIIAQSLAETLPVIGKDSIFDAYGIQRHW